MDFLLDRRSNLGPVLHRFGDIAGFLCSWLTPIPPYFWGVSVAPDRPCWEQREQVSYIRYSVVKSFSKHFKLCDHGTWRLQTDKRTDRRHTFA